MNFLTMCVCSLWLMLLSCFGTVSRAGAFALLLVCLAVAGGCDQAAGQGLEYSSASHAHGFALWERTGVVNPAPGPELRCGGDEVITHGDGHTTPCNGCVDCRAKTSLYEVDALLQPASLVRVPRVAGECADGECAEDGTILPVDPLGDCSCTETTGSCACAGSMRTKGSCASGSCSAGSSGGPVRNAIKARPLRKAAGAIRQAKPVRRLFGRLFGRGC